MTKRAKKTKKQGPNWLLIGGIVLGGVVLIGLMALAFQPPRQLQLEKFCDNNPDNCVVEGDADAPVTIVEVSDYGCSHCGDFNLETAVRIQEAFVKTGLVRWVTMPFALGRGDGTYPTMPTAVSALCAAEQEQFGEYHRAAFALQSSSLFNTEDGFMETAVIVGLDEDAFAQCLANNNYEEIVLRNIQAAQTAGIMSTPSFAVGEDMLRGNQPFSVFEQRITALAGEN
jgi:protein-disulfide isomerase